MDVMIVTTKECGHSKNFSRELDDIGIRHRVLYCEDEPDIVQRLDIRHSPNLVVNGVIVFRRLPTEHELREYFNV